MLYAAPRATNRAYSGLSVLRLIFGVVEN